MHWAICASLLQMDYSNMTLCMIVTVTRTIYGYAAGNALRYYVIHCTVDNWLADARIGPDARIGRSVQYLQLCTPLCPLSAH